MHLTPNGVWVGTKDSVHWSVIHIRQAGGSRRGSQNDSVVSDGMLSSALGACVSKGYMDKEATLAMEVRHGMAKHNWIYAAKTAAIAASCYLVYAFSAMIAYMVLPSRLGWVVLPASVLGLVAGSLVLFFLKTRYQWANVLIVAWMPVIVAWLARGGLVRRATLRIYENGVMEQSEPIFQPDYGFLVLVLIISAISGIATMLLLNMRKSRS